MLYEELDSVYMDTLIPKNDSIFSDSQNSLEFCIDLLEAIFDKEIDKRVLIGSYKTLAKQPLRTNIRQFIVVLE